MPNEENQIPQPIQEQAAPEAEVQINTTTQQNVIKKIADAKNILIALSSDPSVDELSAAIGLSIYIDKMGKKATAIYSGSTPNALEFLEPDGKFVDSADILQDFVVAINKDKADHLRYKPDGDYVKIFITPYASKITEEDLEFSYGDYNVDLVIALDVANGIDLDSALREYGRIMHDAVIINITTGKPGKFGEVEWSEPKMSSVSEILANLAYAMNDEYKVEKDEATAFLTGIVAATDRFSNARTTSASMLMASKLMKSGANEQLIAKNVTPEVDNEMFMASMKSENAVEEPKEGETIEVPKEEKAEADDSLKAAQEALSGAGAEAVQEEEKVLKIDDGDSNSLDEAAAEVMNATYTDIPEATTPVAAPKFDASTIEQLNGDSSESSIEIPEEGVKIESNEDILPKPEKVVAPSADFSAGDLFASEPNKYSDMMADALKEEPANPASAMTPTVEVQDVAVPEIDYSAPEAIVPEPVIPEMPAAPAASATPEVPAATPVSEPIQPAAPAPAPEPTPAEALGAQPAMQDQIYGPAANDPGAFHIPGM